MRKLAIALLAISLLYVNASQGQDYVGISFSPDSLVTCLQDTISYPSVLAAWIVAWALTSPDGIGGWEAHLSWSDSIEVYLQAIAGQAINVGNFPNFAVGLGEPLLQDSLTVLASLTVVANGSGDLYLSAIEGGASIPGATAPVYAEGQDPEVLYEMKYAYGGPDSPVAAIGTSECPQLAEFQQGDFLNAAPLLPELEQKHVIEPVHAIDVSSMEWSEDVFTDNLINWCDAVFIGTVVDTTRLVTEWLTLKAGAIKALIRVERNIAGAPYEHVVCYFWGYDVPGKVIYRNWYPVPSADAFALGRKLFVASRFIKGALYASPLLFCPVEDSNLVRGDWFNWQGAESTIAWVEGRAPLRKQLQRADVIAIGHFSGVDPISFDVNQYVRGVGPYRIDLGGFALPGQGIDNYTPLVIMMEQKAGSLHPIAGRASILIQGTDGRLSTLMGYLLDDEFRIGGQ